MKIFFSILLILFGAFIIVFGGMDDSPGTQGLGLLAIIIGIVLIVKGKKKKSK